MPQFTRREFLGSAAIFAARPLFAAGTPTARRWPYERSDGTATDNVWVRRVHLDLAGRLPTAAEAKDFVRSKAKDKRAALVDRLLASDACADYWSMRFCDILRVKSEFPINLWPNAVYVYHRRIRDFVRDDEPWDHFARTLLTSSGSDFRDAEANFFRATARRTPEGLAETAAFTFLGERWRKVPSATLKALVPYFANVRIKNTRDWKEEIVFVAGKDRRGEFCDRLLGEWRNDFAAAFVQRIDHWLFARADALPAHVDAFLANGFRLKPLLRSIALGPEYARGPLTGGFPGRRLDAEVLDDAICDLTGLKRNYQSIAPEPFTFLPSDRRTVGIEDGSVGNAFLLLFGRPARDSGLLAERDNAITAKQRLYLFNSGRLYQALGQLVGNAGYRNRRMPDIVNDLYWRFYSRPPTDDERDTLVTRWRTMPKGRERGNFSRDLAWALMNSREFLYRI